MNTAFLKPKKGLRLYDPQTRELLPEEGSNKPMTTFWLRRLRDGDVSKVAMPKQTETQVASSSKLLKKSEEVK